MCVCVCVCVCVIWAKISFLVFNGQYLFNFSFAVSTRISYTDNPKEHVYS